VQRTILDAISTPEALATSYGGMRPVGVSLDQIYIALYGSAPYRRRRFDKNIDREYNPHLDPNRHDRPMDAERRSVWRAIRALQQQGKVEVYFDPTASGSIAWGRAVGRPRTQEEAQLTAERWGPSVDGAAMTEDSDDE
jgi:hypothetical protein